MSRDLALQNTPVGVTTEQEGLSGSPTAFTPPDAMVGGPLKPSLVHLMLDDEREAKDGWLHVRTYTEAVEVMQDPAVTVVRMSLDHDLGICETCDQSGTSDCPHTGYKFALWCAEFDRWSVEKPAVHSMNSVGRRAIQSVIDRYWHPPA